MLSKSYITESFLLLVSLSAIQANLWQSANRNYISPRIYGGTPAFPGQFPFMASLRYVNEDLHESKRVSGAVHFCGSAIISDKFLVTAAHCFLGGDLNESNVVAAVGAHSFHRSGKFHSVEKIQNHPKFDSENGSKEYDLSLVEVKDMITFDDRVIAIAMSKNWINAGASPVIMPGWGKTGVNMKWPHSLLYIESTVISNDECKKMHKEFLARFVYNSTICAFQHSGIGCRKGDSGSPLVLNNQLIGVMSWGDPSGVGKPDQYTRITSYLDWITEQTGVKPQ